MSTYLCATDEANWTQTIASIIQTFGGCCNDVFVWLNEKTSYKIKIVTRKSRRNKGGGFKVFGDTVSAFFLSGISVFWEKMYGISVFEMLPVTVNYLKMLRYFGIYLRNFGISVTLNSF